MSRTAIIKKITLAINGLLLLALGSWSESALALTLDLNCQKPETGAATCNNTGLDWGDMVLTDSNLDPISSDSFSGDYYLDVLIDLNPIGTPNGQKVQGFLLNIDPSFVIPANNLWRAWLVDTSLTMSEINQNKIEYQPNSQTGGGGPNLGFFDLEITDSNFEPVRILIGLFDSRGTKPTDDDAQIDLNPNIFNVANDKNLKTLVHIGACGGGTSPYLCAPNQPGNESIWVGSTDEGLVPNTGIPEPNMLALLGIGLLGLAGNMKRRCASLKA